MATYGIGDYRAAGMSNPRQIIQPVASTNTQAPPAAVSNNAQPVMIRTPPPAQIINRGSTQSQVPQTGLIGSEQALNTGLTGGINAINSGTGQARSDLTGAMNQVGTSSAAKMQADLTGANGVQAQQTAMANYKSSPAMQYQMDQMQQATERSAAARGGLLGGNVALELQRNAAGIASQDYQNQFNNIGAVADRDLSSQTIKAGLARDLASTASNAGINVSGLITQTAQQKAQGRMNAGVSIAQNATQAASSIADLLNQRGVVLSDMQARDLSTITDIIYKSGIQDSQSNENLAAILANISGGQGSTIAQGQAAIGASNAAGTIGVANAVQGGIQQGIANYPSSNTSNNNYAASSNAGSQQSGYTGAQMSNWAGQ